MATTANLEQQQILVAPRRFAACVEYNGSKYCGWQRQVHSPSVQQRVEAALSLVANHPIRVICAGRTDTGVHASGQIIHFESISARSAHNWTAGATSNLPEDIAIRWTREVSPEFHARFSAISRTYKYLILCDNQRSAICPGGITRIPVTKLDLEPMKKAMELLLGTHDFSAFRGAHCQAKSPVRRVDFVNIESAGRVIQIEIRANAFLLHMVRNIVGSLLPVGMGEMSLDDFRSIFTGLDRKRAAAAAPPNGLYLSNVEYPPHFDLPESPGRLWLFP